MRRIFLYVIFFLFCLFPSVAFADGLEVQAIRPNYDLDQTIADIFPSDDNLFETLLSDENQKMSYDVYIKNTDDIGYYYKDFKIVEKGYDFLIYNLNGIERDQYINPGEIIKINLEISTLSDVKEITDNIKVNINYSTVKDPEEDENVVSSDTNNSDVVTNPKTGIYSYLILIPIFLFVGCILYFRFRRFAFFKSFMFISLCLLTIDLVSDTYGLVFVGDNNIKTLSFSGKVRIELLDEELTSEDFIKLSIDPNGGVYRNSTEIYKANVLKNTIIDLNEVDREFYKLTYWECNGIEIDLIDNEYKVESDSSLKAYWEYGPYYKLEIDPNGGTYNGSKKIHYEKLKENEEYTLSESSRESYKFKKYEEFSDTKTLNGMKVTMGTQDVKLIARYEKIYIATFDTNASGVTVSPEYIEVANTFEYGEMPVPIRKGYDFKGWYLNDSLIKEDSIFNEDKDVTLKAKWEIITYTISYNLNGGKSDDLVYKYDVETNTFTLAKPTRTGYTFTGWSGSNGSVANTDLVISKGSIGNLSFDANWSANIYNISYDLDGGSIDGNVNTYDITSDDIIIPSPKKTGYTFAGWSGTDLTTKTIKPSIKKGSTGNRSYKANWKINQYDFKATKGTGIANIYYKVDGASYTSSSSDVTKSYDYNTKLYYYATSSTGYTYNTCTETKPCSGTIGVDGLSYNPTATVNTYTLTYDNNGGSGCTSTTGTYGSTWNASCTPTRTGYTFTGWSGVPSSITGNATATAGWKAKTYTLTYDNNGGSGCTSTTGTYGSTWNASCTPTRSEYTFTGWSGVPSSITGDVTVKAIWKEVCSYSAGKSWTYTSATTFTAPCTGTYTLTASGAPGGSSSVKSSDRSSSNKLDVVSGQSGGTASGVKNLNKNDTLSIVTYSGGSASNISYSVNCVESPYVFTLALNGNLGAGGTGFGIKQGSTVLVAGGGGAGANSYYGASKSGCTTNPVNSAKSSNDSKNSSTSGSSGGTATITANSRSYYIGIGGSGGGYPYGGKTSDGDSYSGGTYCASGSLSSCSSSYGSSSSGQVKIVLTSIPS